MSIKSIWVDKFQELLWEYHTCDWDQGNRYPDYPFQLAVASFNWGDDGIPEETVEQAFTRYLETINEQC